MTGDVFDDLHCRWRRRARFGPGVPLLPQQVQQGGLPGAVGTCQQHQVARPLACARCRPRSGPRVKFRMATR